MKNRELFAAFSGFLLAVLSVHAQGTFQNMDFESANLSPIAAGQVGGYVPVTNALPGWSAYLGDAETTQVLHNNLTTGTAAIDILGPDWDGPGIVVTNGPFAIIDGKYDVVLQPGVASGFVNVSIEQLGTIPADAQTLEFKTSGAAAFTVTFAGNSLAPVVIGYGANYTLYGANIAPYATETGQLDFTAIYDSSMDPLALDDIAFSATSVPEPSTLALFVMGGMALAARRWRTKRP
jgi:hypothetical protein